MSVFTQARSLLFTVLVSVFILDAACAAGLCKWTDEDGVVHYAETCPDDKDVQQVKIAPPPDAQRVEEARRRAEAMIREGEQHQAERQAAQLDKRASRSQQEKARSDARSRCVEAMMDLHNLREGEAMYFDEDGRLHDQFSIHSESYTGARRYIEDEEHKALIRQKEEIVQADCEQSREAIIARIAILAERSDSGTCNRIYEQFLQHKEYDRKTSIQQLQATEKAVLDSCN